MKYFKLIYLLVALMPIAGGCSYAPYFSSDRSAVVQYDQSYLWNLQIGREYAAAGRYELAKEHYLMALAVSNDADTRDLVTHELHAVDLMIKAQR